jgi:hypothetical protein
MAVVIRVNGSSAGDGFLIAPDGAFTFPVPLNLSTNDGTTVSATIDATPNGAGITVPGGSVSIGPAGTDIPIHATAVSASRGDTVINVHVGAVVTTFALTAISSPEVWFRGRFEVRFATDEDWYNDPKGTWGAGNDGVNPLGFGAAGPGYTFWLEGEPLFTPLGVDGLGVPFSVPTTTDKPVGRVIRFNNPVAPRSHAASVVTTVDGIRGLLSTAVPAYFTAGDPMIGAPVNLGPNTYLAQNYPPHHPPDPSPFETQPGGDTKEPMALFEFHIEGYFSGKPAADSDRPKSTGFDTWADDPASPIPTITGIPTFAAFNSQRLLDLQHDFNLLSPADQTGTAAGRNLNRRIGHLTGAGGRPQSIQPAWEGQEEYKNGHINNSVTFQPNSSSVASFLAGYTAFTYYSKLHTFHSDELCGYVYGNLKVNPAARLTRTCDFIIDRSTYGQDEIDALRTQPGGAVVRSAFFVVLDGFTPNDLGIVDATSLAAAPVVTFTPATGVTNAPSSLTSDHPTFPPGVIQRIRFGYDVDFGATDAAFGFGGSTEPVILSTSVQGLPANAPVQFIKQPDPYILQGQQTWWLSTDVRLIQVAHGGIQFGQTMGTDPFAFLSSVTTALEAGQGTAGGQSFDTNTTEDDEVISVAPQNAAMQNVYNFAIARVHYQGLALPAAHVRVFFRLFAANTTGTVFDPTSTFTRFPTVYPVPPAQFGQLTIPTPGIQAGEYVTIPCFGSPRTSAVQAGAANTLPSIQGSDPFNDRLIAATGGPLHDTFFGCWLDINQTTPVIPATPPPGNEQGPWPPATGVTVLPLRQAFIQNEHTCIVAEVAFDPDPIPTGTQPWNSDKFAQRNISWSYTANPGVVASRLALEPFEVRPTPASVDPGEPPDELMIDWMNVPAGQPAEIYLPAVDADVVLQMAASLYHGTGLTRVDAHTIGCTTGGVSYIPLPKGPPNGANFTGLLSVSLPAGIKRGQLFTALVRQLTNAGSRKRLRVAAAQRQFAWRQVLGTFQVNIPVSTKEVLLGREEQRLSIFRWMALGKPKHGRWFPVSQRYLGKIAETVQALGGDPDRITPSPDGYWIERGEGLGALVIRIVDRAGATVDDVADVFLQQFELSGRREIRRWHTSEVLVIHDLDAAPRGIWELQVLLDHHKAVGQFVTINEGEVTRVELRVKKDDDSD